MGNSNKGEQHNDNDSVRDRINSGDFQKISPPSSPSINMKKDDMSNSGIMVENPNDTSTITTITTPILAATATFAADLSTPPMSNKTKSKMKVGNNTQNNISRRIVKATPPSSSRPVADDDNSNSKNEDKIDQSKSGGVLGNHHVPTAATVLSSPKGANAANELLEESIEISKNKRMERATNKQKNDREKLLQEKRRQQCDGNREQHQKDQPKANPFSRFLHVFSMEAPNPKHKRKDSTADDFDLANSTRGNGNGNGDPQHVGSGDANKRLKYAFNDTRNTNINGNDNDNNVPVKNVTEDGSSSSNEGDGNEKEGSSNYTFFPSWATATAVVVAASVAIVVFGVVRGSKRK